MPRVAAPTADQPHAYFHGDCPSGIGLPPGATTNLDIKVRLKLLTTALTSAGCLDFSVSFAVQITSDCSGQTSSNTYTELKLKYFAACSPRPNTCAFLRTTNLTSSTFLFLVKPTKQKLGDHHRIISKRALVQREITKIKQKSRK
jgi:hypothetical protein